MELLHGVLLHALARTLSVTASPRAPCACSILPFHTQFARLLSKLRLIVVDEGHAYHGIFGGCRSALEGVGAIRCVEAVGAVRHMKAVVGALNVWRQ